MRSPRRGEIYRLKSDEVGKPRPILIISITQLNGGQCCIAIPFTSQQIEKRKTQTQCVLFERGEFGLTETCVAKVEELSRIRFSDIRISDGPLGQVSEDRLKLIEAALVWVLGINMN